MTLLRIGLVLASLLLLSAPTAARAEETAAPRSAAEADEPCEPGDVPPRDYRCARPRAFTGLIVAGVSTFALGYTMNGLTMVGNQSVDGIAALPVFGSFIAAASHKVTRQSGGFLSFPDFSVGFYLAAGVVQAAGVGIMLGSLAVRHPVLRPSENVSLTPFPLVGAQGSGLGLAGTF
jgi:hypothetical protein